MREAPAEGVKRRLGMPFATGKQHLLETLSPLVSMEVHPLYQAVSRLETYASVHG
jgi:hypothetical protein